MTHINLNGYHPPNSKQKRHHARLSKIYSVIQQQRRKSILQRKRTSQSLIRDSEWNLLVHEDVIKVRKQHGANERQMKHESAFVLGAPTDATFNGTNYQNKSTTFHQQSSPSLVSKSESASLSSPIHHPYTTPFTFDSPHSILSADSTSTNVHTSNTHMHDDEDSSSNNMTSSSTTRDTFYSRTRGNESPIWVPMREINTLLSALVTQSSPNRTTDLFHEYCGKFVRSQLTYLSSSSSTSDDATVHQIVPLRSTRRVHDDFSLGMKNLLELFKKMTTNDGNRMKISSSRGRKRRQQLAPTMMTS